MHEWGRIFNLNSAKIKGINERKSEGSNEEGGGRWETKRKRVGVGGVDWGECERKQMKQSRQRAGKQKGAGTRKMGKWSGSWEARPPNLSLCWRTPHYCTSWALGVAFEVLWGTSSHETSIVNPLVNQVCSWAYVWSGAFSLEDLKRSKGNCGRAQRRGIENFKQNPSAAMLKHAQYPKFVTQFRSEKQALTSKRPMRLHFLNPIIYLNFPSATEF